MDTYENLGNELAKYIETRAEEMRNKNDGYAVFTIGEYDRISSLCDEIVNVVRGAIEREKN